MSFIRLTDKEGAVHLKVEPIYAVTRPTSGTKDDHPWANAVVWMTDENTFFVKENPDDIIELMEFPNAV